MLSPWIIAATDACATCAATAPCGQSFKSLRTNIYCTIGLENVGEVDGVSEGLSELGGGVDDDDMDSCRQLILRPKRVDALRWRQFDVSSIDVVVVTKGRIQGTICVGIR